jgi:hypothetical protein
MLFACDPAAAAEIISACDMAARPRQSQRFQLEVVDANGMWAAISRLLSSAESVALGAGDKKSISSVRDEDLISTRGSKKPQSRLGTSVSFLQTEHAETNQPGYLLSSTAL